MNPIKLWLTEGRIYALGVALFAAHGRNDRLLAMFEQGHSDYRQRRLEEALRLMIEQAERPVNTSSVSPTHKVVTVDEARMPETTVPEAKDTYRPQWLPLYMEMNGLRHQLIHAPDDATRGQWAHRILLLEKQCNAIWIRRDYHLRTGEPMPEEQAPAKVVTNQNDLVRRLNNLRTYVTKENKKPMPRLAKVAGWNEEIADILNQLDHG